MKLSVIIPTYNEAKRITKTLEEIDKYLSRQSYESEIIVADGGSKDRTKEIVKAKQSEIKNLKLLELDGLGKGYVVREGMLAARSDFRVFTDADNSTSIDQVEKMWPEFKNGFDIVIGSRDVKGAILDPPQPIFRRLTGWGFKIYRKIVVGLWAIQDTQCGFKGFSAKAARDIFPKAKINGFAFDPEITVKFSSIIKMAIDMLKIKWNFITRKYA